MRNTLLGILAGMLLVATLVSTSFAEGPAVSGVNGKVGALYGNVDSIDMWAGEASVSVPLCERAGFQLDGAFGKLDEDAIDEDFSGAGVHLFARDPEKYLVGLVGSYAELEDFDVQRYGVEAEGYLGQFTVAATLGRQTGDVDDAGYGTLDLRFYPMENLLVEAGGSFADDDNDVYHVGAEFQIVKGLAAFAEAAWGEDDYDHVFGGLRYYIGTDKSLVKRHREDDPRNNVVGGLLRSLGSIEDDEQAPVATGDAGAGLPGAPAASGGSSGADL